jgi:hypothetical protein
MKTINSLKLLEKNGITSSFISDFILKNNQNGKLSKNQITSQH